MEPIEPVVNRFLIQKITSTGGNGGTLLKAAVIFSALFLPGANLRSECEGLGASRMSGGLITFQLIC